MPTKIQLRRDTAADWTSNNPTLSEGEFGWESDTNRFKIGTGSAAWNSLEYADTLNDFYYGGRLADYKYYDMHVIIPLVLKRYGKIS